MLQDMWNASPGFKPTKSAPSSPAKPLGVSRTRSVGTEMFHVTHKVLVGDSPYVRANNVQLVEKDLEKAIPLFWAAINSGDRVDSALKDMAITLKALRFSRSSSSEVSDGECGGYGKCRKDDIYRVIHNMKGLDHGHEVL
ncbi:hypothetical protein ACFX1S_047146 [Malus domestica]